MRAVGLFVVERTLAFAQISRWRPCHHRRRYRHGVAVVAIAIAVAIDVVVVVVVFCSRCRCSKGHKDEFNLKGKHNQLIVVLRVVCA